MGRFVLQFDQLRQQLVVQGSDTTLDVLLQNKLQELLLLVWIDGEDAVRVCLGTVFTSNSGCLE